VLDPPEAFFLSGGDQRPVFDEAGGGVRMKRVETQYQHCPRFLLLDRCGRFGRAYAGVAVQALHDALVWRLRLMARSYIST
jgi:hypothetical protein